MVRRAIFKCMHSNTNVVDLAAAVKIIGDDGKAKLYKQKMSDEEIVYEETVCDFLQELTQISDIAINNNDIVGLLDNKNNLNSLKLKVETGVRI